MGAKELPRPELLLPKVAVGARVRAEARAAQVAMQEAEEAARRVAQAEERVEEAEGSERYFQIHLVNACK